jgi:hypothetical protein
MISRAPTPSVYKFLLKINLRMCFVGFLSFTSVSKREIRTARKRAPRRRDVALYGA